MSAREEVLSRVRAALAEADRTDVPVPRSYRSRPARLSPDALVDLFVARVEDYRATVTRCSAADVIARISEVLPVGARVVLPAGLPWDVPDGIVDDGLSATDLDSFDAVLTAATVGIAETGTIVLTHGSGEGRRAITLVPDLHVCVVHAGQIVADVPDAFGVLDPVRPQTWVSGPSATSDIELNRVEGVHGPRTLHVLLLS
ncbi:MAG: LutC/YkgG family protein [Nocardioides sp.]